VAGFLLAAILAAIMSTADSQLLVTSSALTEDLYKMYFKKNMSEQHYVWIGRFTVIIIAIIAFFIALNPNSSVLDLVGYAWAGFGAAFGPVVLLSMFWQRMTKNGAIGGIISGGLTVIFWKNLSDGLFNLYELLPAFIIATFVIIGISLIDKPPSKAIIKEFNKVKNISNQ
jgi:sodium/proline symporter